MVQVRFSYNSNSISSINVEDTDMLGDTIRYIYNLLVRRGITNVGITSLRIEYSTNETILGVDLPLVETLRDTFGNIHTIYVDLVEDIPTQHRQNIAAEYMLTYDTYRQWDVPTRSLCSTMKAPTRELLSLMQSIQRKAKKLLVVIHYGDAVKNFTDDYSQYDVLDTDFKFRDYNNKARFLRDINDPEARKVDLKMWSRQQWIYNTLRYATLHGYHVLYIQSDLTYCKYPSMFAEAMMGELYSNVTPIRDMGWHLTGENTDLFCIGDYNVANYLRRYLDRSTVVITDDFQQGIAGDLEWMNMDKGYLDSFYQSQISGNKAPQYLRYPLDLIIQNITNDPSIAHDVVPVNVEILSLMGNPIRGRATYVGDLRFLLPNWNPLSIYSINGYKVRPEFEDLPLVLLLGRNGGQVIYLLSLTNSIASQYVTHRDITFSGSVSVPILKYRGLLVDSSWIPV